MSERARGMFEMTNEIGAGNRGIALRPAIVITHIWKALSLEGVTPALTWIGFVDIQSVPHSCYGDLGLEHVRSLGSPYFRQIELLGVQMQICHDKKKSTFDIY